MTRTGCSEGNCSNRISPDFCADPKSSNLTELTSWPWPIPASKRGTVTIFSSEGIPDRHRGWALGQRQELVPGGRALALAGAELAYHGSPPRQRPARCARRGRRGGECAAV